LLVSRAGAKEKGFGFPTSDSCQPIYNNRYY